MPQIPQLAKNKTTSLHQNALNSEKVDDPLIFQVANANSDQGK